MMELKKVLTESLDFGWTVYNENKNHFQQSLNLIVSCKKGKKKIVLKILTINLMECGQLSSKAQELFYLLQLFFLNIKHIVNKL